MSAIQNVIDFAIEKGGFDSECNTAAAELAQLRADLQAAQERSAEQAAQLEQARNNLSVMTNYCEHWLLTGRDMHGTNDLYILNAAIEASRSWLAANPAPEAEQP